MTVASSRVVRPSGANSALKRFPSPGPVSGPLVGPKQGITQKGYHGVL